MRFPDRETVERVRQRFPVGCRIVLDSMTDPYVTIPPGTQGTVVAVDDIASVHCAWDCGSSLAVAYGADSAHPVATEEEAKITLKHIDQHPDGFCPRCGAMMEGVPIRYALSRRANVMICDRCGREEAFEDAGLTDTILPLMQWKALRETQGGGGPWRG